MLDNKKHMDEPIITHQQFGKFKAYLEQWTGNDNSIKLRTPVQRKRTILTQIYQLCIVFVVLRNANNKSCMDNLNDEMDINVNKQVEIIKYENEEQGFRTKK